MRIADQHDGIVALDGYTQASIAGEFAFADALKKTAGGRSRPQVMLLERA